MAEQTVEDVPGSFGWYLPHLYSRLSKGNDEYLEEQSEKAGGSKVFKINPWEHAACAGDMTSAKGVFNYDLFLKDETPQFFALTKLNLKAASDEGFVPSAVANGEEHAKQKAAILHLIPWWTERVPKFMEDTLTKHFDSWIDSEERDMGALAFRLCADLLGKILWGVPIDASQFRPWINGVFPFIKLPWSWPSTEEACINARNKFHSDLKNSPDMPEIASLLKDIYSDDPDKVATMLLFSILFNGFLGFHTHLVNDLAQLEAQGAEIKERLRKEVDEAVKKTDGVLTRETMSHIVDTEHFFYEVARTIQAPRVYTAIPKEDTVLESSNGRKFRVPAGLKCYVGFAMASQDEKVFKCPHQFNIDRFKDEAEMDNFIFFGGLYKDKVTPTSHQCPAKELAPLLAKWMISHLMLNYDFELTEKPTWDNDTGPKAEPDKPLLLKSFKKRDRS